MWWGIDFCKLVDAPQVTLVYDSQFQFALTKETWYEIEVSEDDEKEKKTGEAEEAESSGTKKKKKERKEKKDRKEKKEKKEKKKVDEEETRPEAEEST